LLTLACLFAAIYVATRRFLGTAGEKPMRRARVFAVVCGTVLALLLVVREALEALIANAAAPLNRYISSPESRWPEQAAVGLFRTLVATIALILIIQGIGRIYWYLEGQLRKVTQSGLRVHIVALLTALLRLGRFVSIPLLVIAFLPVVLNFFPRTEPLVDRIGSYLATPARDVGLAAIGYLPNLGYLVVILGSGLYFLRGVKYFFKSLESGTMVIKGFLPEWADPTYRLARTLFLLFLLMVCFPYLPGSNSQFFQGFSVFVGALITFGSTATIGNIVSGTVLTYTRAFRIGDVVTIGENTGVVIEKNLLVTRLRTFENEEVSIPNGNVLATSVRNYSAGAKEGLILRVTAGIGYDVDWRKVHDLMMEGARATERIATEPAPHVFQSALGDYAVNYELRAYTNEPAYMLRTLSILRANVLDAFNRAGVEIMTPSILAHRDASNLAVPQDQFPNRPKPSGIAVEVRSDGSVSSPV
jgi:small-conductance mechanosensitive channel